MNRLERDLMIKVDLHIHTASSSLEEDFDFDSDLLRSHVSENKLDVIAVTNHNQFDRENYNEVVSALSETECVVLPGIELSAAKTHFIIVCDENDSRLLEEGCKKLADLNAEPNSLDEVLNLFPNLDEWICIPHYKKDPSISEEYLEEFDEYIDALETTSLKKAIELTKAEVSEKPIVCFTDCRFGGKVNPKPAGVYLRTDGRTCSSLKEGFRSEFGAMFNASGTEQFELADGVLASETLNVLIGKRSSGKTYTLKRIESMCDKDEVYFIRQGALTHDSEEDEFYNGLNQRYYNRTAPYYQPWSLLLEKAKERGDRDSRQNSIKEYLLELKKYAETSTLADVFSKCPLFSPTLFEEIVENEYHILLKAVCTLLEASDFDKDIAPFVSRVSLIQLAVSLEKKARDIELKKVSAKKANDIISSVKTKLSAKSAQATHPIPILRQVASDYLFFNRLSTLLEECWKEKEILNDNGLIAGKYSLVAVRQKHEDAAAVKRAAGITENLGRIMQSKAPDYLDKMLSLQSASSLARGLFDVRYEIRNDRGVKPSGGQRTEFVFFERLSEAAGYSVVLIDEPEASFDNMFLSKEISSRIREIAKSSTVFVTTHSHILCFDLKPGKVIYAFYDEENSSYGLLAGSLSDSELRDSKLTASTKNTILDLMEAGKDSFDLRRQYYETI